MHKPNIQCLVVLIIELIVNSVTERTVSFHLLSWIRIPISRIVQYKQEQTAHGREVTGKLGMRKAGRQIFKKQINIGLYEKKHKKKKINTQEDRQTKFFLIF